jgi:AcrR family transcriptional regulator
MTYTTEFMLYTVRCAGQVGVIGMTADQSAALLWGERERPSRGPKPGLSVQRIARAAVTIADAESLPAVSMQRVAATFDLTAMSLYRYVPGKTELVHLMIDTALGEPPDLAGIPGGWRPQLAQWTHKAFAGMLRHPWLAEALARPRPMGPNELDWLDSAVGALNNTGLTGGELVDAAVVLAGHARSTAQNAAAMTESAGYQIPERLRQHADRYPALVAATSTGAFEPDDANAFEFGLERILDGIGVLIAARTP